MKLARWARPPGVAAAPARRMQQRQLRAVTDVDVAAAAADRRPRGRGHPRRPHAGGVRGRPPAWRGQHRRRVERLRRPGRPASTSRAETLVYCQTGNRSGVATDEMVDLGFTDMSDLQGGIEAWAAAGEQVVQQ